MIDFDELDLFEKILIIIALIILAFVTLGAILSIIYP